MKIQLKRSSVLSAGVAKEPTAPQMEYGELAVNYNVDDPAIFIKDSNNNIIRIAGYKNIAWDGNTEIPSGPTPPADPVPGNFWYNPEDGRLYYYYEDANSSQWVDASPDNWQGAGTVPDVDNPAYQPDTLDDRYVNITGDNMTGDLTLGTDKITLNATDGSAEFTSTIKSNRNIVARRSDNGAVFTGGTYTTPSVNEQTTFRVAAAGDVSIGGTLPDSPNIHLYSDGSATFAGRVQGSYFHRLGECGLAFSGVSIVPVGANNEVGTGSINLGSINYYFKDGYFTGNVRSNGGILTRNVVLELEIDDDTKYTSTTDADGNETRVYNGETLDVKDRLQKADAALLALKTAALAATDFASLQSAIVTALADI